MAVWGDLYTYTSIPMELQGRGQGYFRYYRADGTYQAISAINGQLIIDGGVIPITGLPEGFQKDKIIESVQWKNIMFFATGTKLVEYDGSVAKVVEPYQPNPLEVLNIGTNALSPTPDTYVTDGQADFLTVQLIADKMKGIANVATLFTAIVQKPDGQDVEYQFNWKHKDANIANPDSWTLGQDWSASKQWTFQFPDTGDYTIEVLARYPGDPPSDPQTATLPSYTVYPMDKNVHVDSSRMNECNRILLHYNRLIMYGDPLNPSLIYISELNNPRYFPTDNTLDFENTEQEPIQKIVQYRNAAVVFLKSSIQLLSGTGPIGNSTYSRTVIHTGLGCIAPESACVFGNYVAFLSKEGIQILKSFALYEDRMNVSQIDLKVRNLIPQHEDACAVVYDNQYMICFPQLKQRFRLYQQSGAWTMDESPYLEFSVMKELNGDLVGQSQSTGKLYLFDELTYKDVDYTYDAVVETKGLDFGAPYNPKKLKELQLIAGLQADDINLAVTVFADNNAIVSPTSDKIYIDQGVVKRTQITENNVKIDAGTALDFWDLGSSKFGSNDTEVGKVPLAGKCRTVKILIEHRDNLPMALLGTAIMYKLKKP